MQMTFIGSFDSLPQGSYGDICVVDGTQYICTGTSWEPFGEIEEKPVQKIEYKPRFCTQCAAPLSGIKCEYCGTVYGIVA